MSSPPRESEGDSPPPRIRWYNYWPKWRRIMMGGALVLLAGALVPAIMGEEDAPAWVSNATLIVGYGCLAYGFLLAMRARKGPGQKWTGDTKDGWSPPDEGEQS